MADQPMIMDELDQTANEVFAGLVVRKDLLRRMRSAFGVPAFVIEFLLGKYCASTDEETIKEGLEFVRETLSSKYVKPDEREAVKSAIKQHSTYEVIDKISVELVETHDKYWARLSNLNLDYINIDETEVRNHDRLLMGGVWAEISLRYDESFIFKGQNRPFFVESLRPIQLSSRNIEQFIEGRKRAEVAARLFVARGLVADFLHRLETDEAGAMAVLVNADGLDPRADSARFAAVLVDNHLRLVPAPWKCELMKSTSDFTAARFFCVPPCRMNFDPSLARFGIPAT